MFSILSEDYFLILEAKVFRMSRVLYRLCNHICADLLIMFRSTRFLRDSAKDNQMWGTVSDGWIKLCMSNSETITMGKDFLLLCLTFNSQQ